MRIPIEKRLFLSAAALVVLSGCASTASAPHPRGSTTGGAPAMGAPMEPMDMQAMCERHKKMMAGRSPQEQQAMMQEQMKGMPPEMRQRMEGMVQQCR